MRRDPSNTSMRRPVRSLGVIALATLTLSAFAPIAHPADSPARAQDIVGVYLIATTPDMSARMMLPSRLFQYMRLADDGRSRIENVTISADGPQVTPRVDVGPWSRAHWQVKAPTGTAAPQLCIEGPTARVICSPFSRDVKTGDLILYNETIGGSVAMILRRASKLN
ncbi:MAG: hypothetical protein H3C62_04405 [Gemmatimonadaceae bacterium]|nr:hypothetical protein [Gemmatimonadaceae bacterium]